MIIPFFMNQTKFLEALKSGECETIEFKMSYNDLDPIGETIASFSSSGGGNIYVGVDDDRTPQGVECDKKIKDKIVNLVSSAIKPAIKISFDFIPHSDNKEILIINVEKGNGHYYSYKDKFYERVGATNRVVPFEEIYKKKVALGETSYLDLPARINERPAYVSDISGDKVMEYLKICEEERGKKYNFISIKQMLINLGLLIQDNIQVTYNGIIIFGKEPQKFLPNSTIKITIWEGNDKTSKFIPFNTTGTLYETLDNTILILNRYIKKVSRVEGLKRIQVVEYPLEALREAIINAIAHRDYFPGAPEIFIDFYKNRIEITNHATFPFQGKTFEEIKNQGISVRRNQKIANLLDDMGLMDERARGLTNIKKLMINHGLKEPTIEVTANFFKIILYGVEGDIFQLEKTSGKVLDLSKFNERQIKVMEMLESNLRYLTRRSYLDIFKDISEKQATRDLRELHDAGILDIEGIGRGLKYKKKIL